MATLVDVKKLRRGLKKLEPYMAPYGAIENHSELRRILMMINLDSVDYSTFNEETARLLSILYCREDVVEDLEAGLSEATNIIKTLNGLPPGGASDVRFF